VKASAPVQSTSNSLSNDLSQRLVVILTVKSAQDLQESLDRLAAQTLHDFDVFVWNNHRDQVEAVDDTCMRIADHLPVITVHSYEDFYGRGSQVLARRLRLRHGYRYVVFLDTGVPFSQRLLTRLWDERQPNTIVAARVWRSDGVRIFPHIDAEPGEHGFYANPCGAIVDLGLFTYTQYWSLWPQRYWPLHDAWMSVMAQALSWTIVKSSLAIRLPRTDEHDEDPKIRALWGEFNASFVVPQGGRYGEPLYAGPLP